MLGLVIDPPATVGGLAAALGIDVAGLAASGMSGMGSILASPAPSGDADSLAIDYAWDLHHERPVESAAELAGRELTAYAVGLARGVPP